MQAVAKSITEQLEKRTSEHVQVDDTVLGGITADVLEQLVENVRAMKSLSEVFPDAKIASTFESQLTIDGMPAPN